MIYLYKTLFLLLVIFIAGCAVDESPPSAAEIVGTYKGQYGGGTEEFEIHGDGTFLQMFRGGTNAGYKLEGKWVYETNMVWKGQSTKISRITLKPFMIPGGMAACVTNTKVGAGCGEWKRDPMRIEIGPWPYYVAKVQRNGANVK